MSVVGMMKDCKDMPSEINCQWIVTIHAGIQCMETQTIVLIFMKLSEEFSLSCRDAYSVSVHYAGLTLI